MGQISFALRPPVRAKHHVIIDEWETASNIGRCAPGRNRLGDLRNRRE